MKQIRERLSRIYYRRLIVGIVFGAVGGYLYYHYVGCVSGTCAITSDPVNSTLYGMLIGATFMYKENRVKTDKPTEN